MAVRSSLVHLLIISTHAPRVGSDIANTPIGQQWLDFNPRSPRGERPGADAAPGRGLYFNPRSPRGERRGCDGDHAACGGFQPTLPAWGATRVSLLRDTLRRNFNPRSPRGERPGPDNPIVREGVFQPTLPAWGATRPTGSWARNPFISTHAPRVGSDPSGASCCPGYRYFNPRSPRGERHLEVEPVVHVVVISTHAPRVGSDFLWFYFAHMRLYFNPRSPRGKRQKDRRTGLNVSRISTHAPRVGSDTPGRYAWEFASIFQPTLPAWGATQAHRLALPLRYISTHAPRVGSDATHLGYVIFFKISTHAPRVGSDKFSHFVPCLFPNFNPRSPRGERLKTVQITVDAYQFQPTLPAWGATNII